MNLDASETQVLLRETVREYLAKEIPFDRVRRIEREGGWDAGLWDAICRQGWIGLPFVETLGGGGGSLVDTGIVVEEFARRAALIPILECTSAGLALAGSRDAGEAAIPAILSGAMRPVPAVLEESDRFDAIRLEVTSEGRITGEKWFVDFGPFATHHLVMARQAGQLGLFLVDIAESDVEFELLSSIGRTPVCIARYKGASSERIGDAPACSDLIRVARLLAAVQCLGSMQEALDQTVAYASVRKQFGRPIGSFQAVRHHCADMAMRVASVRLLVYEALDAIDRGQASDRQIATAKASAARAVPEVTLLAHQIHGGNGVIEENDLYFFMLRGKASSLAWGSAEECQAIVGRTVEDLADWI